MESRDVFYAELGGYKLRAQAMHVTADVPTHRAQSHTRATLAVLPAASTRLKA